MSKLRLIQCGVGGFGKTWLTEVATQSGDFEVVAVVDTMEQNLTVVGDEAHIRAERRFATLEDALAKVQADAVLTVTPPPVHVQHARLAFAHGLHLMTEKPFADTVEHAREMLELSRKAGRRMLVSQNYRYNAPFVHARQLVADKALGELGSGHLDFYIAADFRKTFRETMDFPLLIDMTIHHLDLIRYVTGRNVLKVTAHSFNPPGSTFQHHAGLKMLLELEGDAPFTYSGDWSARGRTTTWSGDWRLQGSEGSLEIEEDKLTLTRSDFWGRDPKVEKPEGPALALSARAATLHEFAEAIRSGRPSELDGEKNLWSFAAVVAGVESARLGMTVNVAQIIGVN